MVEFQKPEFIRPDEATVELTKIILKQHDEIIRINAVLLKLLASPIVFFKEKD